MGRSVARKALVRNLITKKTICQRRLTMQEIFRNDIIGISREKVK